MSQNRKDTGERRSTPFQFSATPAALTAKSQSQVIDDQVPKNRVRGAEFHELVED
jgi:hypothetical protein